MADLRRRFKLAIGRIALAGLLDPESAKDAESRRLGLGLLAQVFTRDESLTPALVFQRVAAGLADALGVLQIVARQAAKAAKDGAAEDDARSWLALVDDLDFGCALMLRNLQITGSLLALETRGSDLMVDATMQANGDAGTLRRLLALCEAVQPEEFMAEDGPVAYAIREAAAKVELVHELAGRLPHLAREEARQMDAWPLLVSRREADGRRHREWLK
ncbi:MAG TPA: hypothetical protein PKE47_05405, partial [Verrucomicrobiota bacterium]|nr:hypothetical protein [Verrucomicrobiota bacterium]